MEWTMKWSVPLEVWVPKYLWGQGIYKPYEITYELYLWEGLEVSLGKRAPPVVKNSRVETH